MCLFDAPMGYHHICITIDSNEVNLCWTQHNEMGSQHCPAIWICQRPLCIYCIYSHNVDSTWNDLACSCGLPINEDTNTNIIVGDILIWVNSLISTLLYMECQLPTWCGSIPEPVFESEEITHLPKTF